MVLFSKLSKIKMWACLFWEEVQNSGVHDKFALPTNTQVECVQSQISIGLFLGLIPPFMYVFLNCLQIDSQKLLFPYKNTNQLTKKKCDCIFVLKLAMYSDCSPFELVYRLNRNLDFYCIAFSYICSCIYLFNNTCKYK